MLLVGPLADNVFEPAMIQGGWLADTFGWLVGSGSGAGMALIIIFAGLAMSAVGLAGYLVPAVREAEVILPDHEVNVEDEIDLYKQLQELLALRQQLIADPNAPDRDQALKQVSLQLRELGRQRT
jgi:hypothetical protein